MDAHQNFSQRNPVHLLYTNSGYPNQTNLSISVSVSIIDPPPLSPVRIIVHPTINSPPPSIYSIKSLYRRRFLNLLPQTRSKPISLPFHPRTLDYILLPRHHFPKLSIQQDMFKPIRVCQRLFLQSDKSLHVLYRRAMLCIQED